MSCARDTIDLVTEGPEDTKSARAGVVLEMSIDGIEMFLTRLTE